MRQLLYTMCITNNHDPFHLWWKKNLVKHQKVSKYYDQDCRLSLFLTCFYFRKPYCNTVFQISQIFLAFKTYISGAGNIKKKSFSRKIGLLSLSFEIINKSKRNKEEEVINFKEYGFLDSGWVLFLWCSYIWATIQTGCS